MPDLKHLKPCGQCPWRRNSAPGWLGAATPKDFLLSTQTECEMPCHSQIDYSDPEWESRQYPEAPLCAGALIFMANSGKSPRDPKLSEAVRSVEKDPERVFQWGHEFLQHHEGKIDG